MKVIFLDIDGVLNSYDYYEKTQRYTDLIDADNLKVLKEIVNQTDARIVLTSSWRRGWRHEFEDCTEEMQEMLLEFHKFGLEVFSRTGCDETCRREMEIFQWIKKCQEPIDGIVILDDGPFEWKKKHLESYVVKTDFQKGGLLKEHIKKAVDILNQPLPLRYRLRKFV
ncbi:MAG: HAD domain-containing protein [Anaerostipes sp.]|nr:HAD domain-containing protein [Anaerostipes sp.]